MEQLNDSPAYFFRLPEATSRRRFSPNFDGTLGLMIPNGFGNAITSFENPYRQADSHTPDLTVGHTPSSAWWSGWTWTGRSGGRAAH